MYSLKRFDCKYCSMNLFPFSFFFNNIYNKNRTLYFYFNCFILEIQTFFHFKLYLSNKETEKIKFDCSLKKV